MKLFNVLLFTMSLWIGHGSPAIGQPRKSPHPTFSTGYQFLVSTYQNTPFHYTKSFRPSGPNFLTVYKIYHPRRRTHFLTITATHYKAEHRVVVEVEDTNESIFSLINREETTYEATPWTGFGFLGAVGGLGGKRVPNQLGVQFTSRKADYVKVLSVAGSQEDGDNEFFTLDSESRLPLQPATTPRQAAKPTSWTASTTKAQARASLTAPESGAAVSADPSVYTFLEQMPEYEPGSGEAGLRAFLQKQVVYPGQARRMGIEGKVFVSFIVDEQGQVVAPTVVKGLGSGWR